MSTLELKDLWTPAGIILGFQMTVLMWRIQQEEAVRSRGHQQWLIPSDYLSILGLLVLVLGTMLLPILQVISLNTAKALFGLGTLFFVGQILGVAGHYQLFGTGASTTPVWFPMQERVVILTFVVIAIIYLVFAMR